MYNYEYVYEDIYSSDKQVLISMIEDAQDEISDYFTFSYLFVGSSSRNMVTCDYTQNTGFDFDVDIFINDDDENFTAKEIKMLLMKAFDSVNQNTRYDNCHDLTRVFTIKHVNAAESRINHSYDFAIINECPDESRQYIHHNKKNGTYSWEYKKKGYYNLSQKARWCKHNNLWNEVRDTYLVKKNTNLDLNKHSSSIYAETINQVCNNHGYSD